MQTLSRVLLPIHACCMHTQAHSGASTQCLYGFSRARMPLHECTSMRAPVYVLCGSTGALHLLDFGKTVLMNIDFCFGLTNVGYGSAFGCIAGFIAYFIAKFVTYQLHPIQKSWPGYALYSRMTAERAMHIKVLPFSSVLYNPCSFWLHHANRRDRSPL